MALTFKGLTFKKDAPIIVDPSRPLVQQAPPQQASIDFSKIQVIPQGAPQEQQAGFIRQLPGMAAKAVMAAPPAIASAAEQFMQSERERQAQQTLPQQAYYELVERPLKILGFFAGGMSEAGKTMMEFAATGALAPFRGVGEASLIAQEAVRGDAQQQELERKLFGFNPKSYADYVEPIRDWLSKHGATDTEKKILPLALPIIMLGADMTPFGGGGRNVFKAVAKLDDAEKIYSTLKPVYKNVDEATLRQLSEKLAPIKKESEVEAILEGAKRESKSLTTKFLEYAEEKLKKNPNATLSRQEILDFARRPELKKGEADLLNNLAKDLPEGKIPAQEFADSIRRDLLELKPITLKEGRSRSPDEYRIGKKASTFPVIRNIEGKKVRVPTIKTAFSGTRLMTGKVAGKEGLTDGFIFEFESPKLVNRPAEALAKENAEKIEGFLKDVGSWKELSPPRETAKLRDVRLAVLKLGTEDVFIDVEKYNYIANKHKDVSFVTKGTGEPIAFISKGEVKGFVAPASAFDESVEKVVINREATRALASEKTPAPEAESAVNPSQSDEKAPRNLPTVIEGETFTLKAGDLRTPSLVETKSRIRQEIKATQEEAKNARIAKEKAEKLALSQKEARDRAIAAIHRQRGRTERIITILKSRNLSDEDIANIVLEDGTKLTDTVKIKRTRDGTLSTVITKREIEEIRKSYTEELPREKWEKRNILVEGAEVATEIAGGLESPFLFFERKGLGMLFDPVIQAGRDAETMKTMFIDRFRKAGLVKERGWFTAERFDLSENEAEGIARYYLGRQGRGIDVPLDSLSARARAFIEIFDGIIRETEEEFFETARRMGKTPGKVENYAPIMTRSDIKLADEAGSMEWLFRNHPAFFSLKERAEKVPFEMYEMDYREVAVRWLDGITQFLNYADATNHLKYVINSDEFKGIVRAKDFEKIGKWLEDVTTQKKLKAVEKAARAGRRLGSIGALGFSFASILKQTLSIVAITILEKAPPKLTSEYAKAFGIDVAKLPSITKRSGDIAVQDLQRGIARVFTGPMTEMDRKVAQAELNALLDKEYKDMVGKGIDITPEARRLIEKRAQDTLDLFMGGFFNGQKPEYFRRELGNFIFMFLYPLTSQLNAYARHVYIKAGMGSKAIAAAEVVAAAAVIAYLEQSISNLSFKWSDEKEMVKDIGVSLAGNIPLLSDVVFALTTNRDLSVSPVISNINQILRNMAKREAEKAVWSVASALGVPKAFERAREGLEILEEGGITDDDGKMLVEVRDAMEIVRSFLRGKYGSLAAQDWVRNIGEKSENRRWFVPEVEFLQNGDYKRKAQLYQTFDEETRRELRQFLSDGQRKRLDRELGNLDIDLDLNLDFDLGLDL